MNAQTKIEASLASAYVAAFAEIEGAVKDATNPHFKKKYADLPAVIAAVKPALTKHGLAFTQPCEASESGVTVRTVLHHVSGERLDLGSLFVPANRNDAQGFGSALTYARRYALVSAFGVPTEDDDGNAAATSLKATKGERNEGGMPDDELRRLTGKMKAAGVKPEVLQKKYSVTDLRDLNFEQFNDAIERCDKRIFEKAKAESNAGAQSGKQNSAALGDDEIPY